MVTANRSRFLLLLASACVLFGTAACGISKRTSRDDAGGAASSAGGTGGSGAAGAGMTSVPVTTEPRPEAPRSTRHEYLASTAPAACFTGVVATPDGLVAVGKYRGRSGLLAAMSDQGGSRWGSITLTSSEGAAIVFRLPAGYAIAWSPGSDGFPAVERFGDDGNSQPALFPSVQGTPVAGVGFDDGVALVFVKADGTLSLWRSRADRVDQVPLETGPCVADGAFAAGISGDDVLVAYSCHMAAGAPDPARRLVVMRVPAGTAEAERTESDADVTGVPAASFLGDDGFVFAASVDAVPTLIYVTPGGGATRRVPIVGLTATGNRYQSNPTYSVVATDSDVLVTRSGCYGHEDASPTGTVALCHVAPDTGEATCSEVDAPCAGATLCSTDSGIVLLPCSSNAPAIVPIPDLAAPPVPLDGSFVLGDAALAPIALDCDGDVCTALVQLDAVEATTGYDLRLGSLAIDLGPSPDGTATGPLEAPTPGALHTKSAYDVYPGGFTLENQPRGFPFGVVSSKPVDPLNDSPALSLVAAGDVLWTQPLSVWPSAIYATGADFRLLGSGSAYGIAEASVSSSGVTAEPALAVSSQNRLLSTARCGERVLIHALTVSTSSTIAPHPAIFALDLGTNDFAPLFDTGLQPADSSEPQKPIACAGERVFVLDGLKLHVFTLDGTRQPDIGLAALAPPRESFDPVIGQLETGDDRALLLRASSGSDTIDALYLFADGGVRSYSLPLPSGLGPLTRVLTAPDRGDGWLRALYQTRDGAMWASAWELEGSR